jgi:hypothetical protein
MTPGIKNRARGRAEAAHAGLDAVSSEVSFRRITVSLSLHLLQAVS